MICDNVMIGRDDHYRLNGWSNPGIYGSSPVRAYFGVKVYGQGHIICHNDIRYFHDGICICTHGSPEKEQSNKSVAIDIYNNLYRGQAPDLGVYELEQDLPVYGPRPGSTSIKAPIR